MQLKEVVFLKKHELLIKSREAMLAAVQIYNNPQITFKSEIFISMAIISWTYLMHTYYANKGIDYRYYSMRGKRKCYDKTKYGAYKHWELERCLCNDNNPLDKNTTDNLKFLIGIRHEIEHQMTNKIDKAISAKLQACSINYNYYIKKLFGSEYGVDNQLGLAIQFSPITPEQKGVMLNNEQVKDNVQSFICEFEDNLTEEEAGSPKYAYRLLFTPLSAKRKGQADQVIEFVKAGTEEGEKINKTYTLIKETEKKKYRGKEIVSIMKEKGYDWFNINMMTDFWKYDLKSRDMYGVALEKQWYWYENWIPVVEEFCKKKAPHIDPKSIKKGYYPQEIVAKMVQLGYDQFSMRDFMIFWRDILKIKKENTIYGYKMNNNRFVWNEKFLEKVKEYCSNNKEKFEALYED